MASSPKKKRGRKAQKDSMATPKTAKTSTAKTPTAPKPIESLTTPKPAESSNINNDSTPKAPESAPKKGFPRWSVEEDKKLCIAWLNTSRDPIVGNGQKASTFWERIHNTLSELITEYNEEKKNSKGFKELPLRPVGAVECRWALIMKLVNKFSGCYANVERRMKSGKTREDMLTEAKELYKATFESSFNLDHCWGILKDTPKWQATQQENEARNKKGKQSGAAPPSSDIPSSTPATSAIEVEDEESEASRLVLGNSRSEGQKAAKRKRTEEISLDKLVSMQKDLIEISRDRLSSMKAAAQSTSDDAIMSKDLTLLDAESRAYYQRKKRAIIARELQEEKEREEKEKKEKEKKEKEKTEKERKAKEEKERQAKEEQNQKETGNDADEDEDVDEDDDEEVEQDENEEEEEVVECEE
ncbi:hypothetical protein PGT21_050280 [Puccinia graminis f. sp. tritici]|uniref:No apical meristem-associated C-terminal domain-containing protein n=1 Tax=Puccinia graminis f. sp. tritici TaxID=56615 RepID=A0A5B0R1U2_PUCGR|nr:hypothetical protein PGT21_050280 [Puccinia graminis f. sp. tritici]